MQIMNHQNGGLSLNILFTINRGYRFQTQTCIRSLARFETPGGYDIYIMHQDLTDDDITMLSSLENSQLRLHIIDVTQTYFARFPTPGGYPKEMYFRLIASQLLPTDLERILYLDPDIIVINDLQELYHQDFAENFFIATTHVEKALTKINAYRLGLEKEVPYINTGVLLMNLDALRTIPHLEKDIQTFVESHRNVLTLPDQDIITALFGDKTRLVDMMIYNLSDRMLKLHNLRHPQNTYDLDWVRKNTVIIHYCGKNKPWNDHYYGILNIFYQAMVEAEEVTSSCTIL